VSRVGIRSRTIVFGGVAVHWCRGNLAKLAKKFDDPAADLIDIPLRLNFVCLLQQRWDA
jgi:hypothetical protein